MRALIDFLRCQDLRITHLFNRSCRCRPLDILMHLATQLASPVAVIILGLLFWSSASMRHAEIARALSLILIISHLLVQLVKFLVVRPRPYRAYNSIVAQHPPTTKRSFPSGHSCAAFAIALTLGSFFPALSFPLWSLASLVGVSRIYLGAHYPSDVMGGLAIALAVFLIYP